MTGSARIRSGGQPPLTADVVVIGAGVNGLATAFQLAKRKAGRVVVLEKGRIASGATGKSGALVRQHYTNLPEALLTLHSLRIFNHWADEIGPGDPGFRTLGFLRVVRPEDELNLRRNVDAMREAGINTWVIPAEDLAEVEPLLNTEDISAAAFEPDAGYADPNATAFAFAQAAAERGALIDTGTPATAILVDGDRVAGVQTPNGRIDSRQVLLAAGPWANGLLGPLGIDLGLVPYKSQVVIFRWPMEIEGRRKHRVVIDSVYHSWLRPEGESSTLIGVEFPDRAGDPDHFPEFPPPDYVDAARTALAARFPVFKGATMRGGWTGMYMMSPDAHPIIGAAPGVDGLYLMTGDSGSSFKTAPATGICLAELMLDGRASLVDLTPFRPSRFAEGKPWVDEFRYSEPASKASISR
jgi:sarcosine oxidase subunit beta